MILPNAGTVFMKYLSRKTHMVSTFARICATIVDGSVTTTPFGACCAIKPRGWVVRRNCI